MDNKRCIVMVPTFNEAGNVGILVESILSLGNNFSVVVIDNESTDGTSDIVRDLSDKSSRVELVSRSGKRGRGLAGIAGYKYSLRAGADLIVEMDADMSHDPKYIPDLVSAMRECDMTIGSRFVPGGCDERGSFLRRRISVFAKGFIACVLGIKVNDPTSGYRCFSRKALGEIVSGGLEAETPFIVLETLCKIIDGGFAVKEVPICFHSRAEEESKLKFFMLIDCFMDVIVYRLTGHPRKRLKG